MKIFEGKNRTLLALAIVFGVVNAAASSFVRSYCNRCWIRRCAAMAQGFGGSAR